jgi:hypothetical protein
MQPLGCHTGMLKLFEDAIKAVVLLCRGLTGIAVAAPDNRNLRQAAAGHGVLLDSAAGMQRGKPLPANIQSDADNTTLEK